MPVVTDPIPPLTLFATAEPNFLDQPYAVALVGVGAALLGYLFLRGAGKRKRDPLADMPQKRSLAQQRNLERDMQQLLMELTDMTRQMNAQIDTKAAKLEQLIADAEQAERRLRAAMGDQAKVKTAVQPVPEEKSNLELPDKPALAPLQRHEQVYRLADEGVSIDDIAHRLDRPRGEIDLILALRRP